MFVTLRLDSTDQPAEAMEALSRELYQILGVHYDGLLLWPKVRSGHASWIEIHTGKGRVVDTVTRGKVFSLVQEYLPEVKGVTHVDHFEGIPYDFARGYVRYGR